MSGKTVTLDSAKDKSQVHQKQMIAGHFDRLTAYAAANTMRIDDMNPHFFQTHDGGKTWAEINSGISGGAVSNAIREDPRQRGLLYASTDTQVWVSFDDGEH